MINSLFVMSPTGYVRSLSFPPSDFPSCPWTVRQIRVGMVRVGGGGQGRARGAGLWDRREQILLGQARRSCRIHPPSMPLKHQEAASHPRVPVLLSPLSDIHGAFPPQAPALCPCPWTRSCPHWAAAQAPGRERERERERERKRERESRLGRAKLLCSAAETLKRDTCFQRALGWVSSSPDDYALISACPTYHPFSPFPGTMLGNLTRPPLPAFPHPSHPTPLPLLSPSPDSLAQGGAH